MSIFTNKQTQILHSIGIDVELEKLPASINFTTYTTDEYRNSQRRDTDEVYGMYEINLLHHQTGLRIRFTSREDYFGNVIYKCIRLYIITSDNIEIDIEDMDHDRKVFITTEKVISFHDSMK